ncbi:HAD family hydrolase [Pectinatus sottacetonis]|uniref:HAD family hydrolase n=1 Tax=Pectinatus sottacetonis TaxID=1002795 RepID=UPI0018C6A979|nr:HAD family phosphatase [Pectinatus sottacetonis]
MKAFIFDMDGVIINSEPFHNKIISEVLAKYNIYPADDYLASLCGLTINNIFTKIKQDFTLDISIKDAVKIYDNRLLEGIRTTPLKPIDGIPELLINLYNANIPAAVASSSPIEFIKASISNLHLNNYFSFLLSGNEVKHGKPAPDIYIAAAQRLSLKPADCVVLEDSNNGAAAAKAAGMICIGFQNPSSGKQDLSITDMIVTNIQDIDINKL